MCGFRRFLSARVELRCLTGMVRGASMTREPLSPLDGDPVTGMWPTGLGVPSVALDSGVLPE